jgi:hypothetical protein
MNKHTNDKDSKNAIENNDDDLSTANNNIRRQEVEMTVVQDRPHYSENQTYRLLDSLSHFAV